MQKALNENTDKPDSIHACPEIRDDVKVV